MSSQTKPTIVILSESERIIPLKPLIESLSKNNFQVIVFFQNEIDYSSPETVHSIHASRDSLFNLSNVSVQYLGTKRSWLVRVIRHFFYKPNLRLFKLFMWSKHFTVGQLLFEWDLISTFKFHQRIAKKCFDRNNVCALITITDKNIGNGQPGFIKAAKQASIPVLLPHYHYRDATTRTLKGNKKYTFYDTMSSYQKRTFEKYSNPQYGRQLFENYFFYPAYCIEALDKFGLLSKNPWMIGAGSSDIVIADHQYTVERYTQALTPVKKIHTLGDFSFDSLFQNYKNREFTREFIIDKYQLNNKNKIFIIALPPLFEHRILVQREHWSEINFLLNAALRDDINLLISLHPKMNIVDYAHLEQIYNLKILEEPLNETLPIADLFMSSLSTTILWSVMCGINTIMIDFYNFESKMYSFLDSIKFIDNRADLSPTITKLLTNKQNFSNDWEVLSRGSVFDGQVLNRYLDLFDQLAMDKSKFVYHRKEHAQQTTQPFLQSKLFKLFCARS